MGEKIGMNLRFLGDFASGFWLENSSSISSDCKVSIIITTAWLLRKAWCKLMFQNMLPDYLWIVDRAHEQEYTLQA